MDDSPAGKGRRECFVHALIATSEELQAKKVMPSDDAPQSTNDKVTDVIFVIHGIRDEGFWTQKIARHVKFVGESTTRHFQTETLSYGYFAMLPFLLPSRRRAKVEWLMDQYTEALARYPKAEYSFVGHSNGTYMLARALRDYPACHFKRVVFAGSVVRCDYEWAKLLREKRVEAVLNYVATADWVVALFPKALQPLRVFDLGSAGHDGFEEASPAVDQVHQFEYVRGRHDAAIHEQHWDAIARFIVFGTPPPRPVAQGKDVDLDRSWWLVAAGRVAPGLWLVGIGLLVLGGWRLLHSGWPEWLSTVALVVYLWLIWKVVTRF